MAKIKTDKFVKHIKKNLEDKIKNDNGHIRDFFEDSFGKLASDINEEDIEDTYMYFNPKITTEKEVIEGWEDIKTYLSGIPKGTNCSSDDENASADVDYLFQKGSEDQTNDFDLQAHIITTFTFTIKGPEKSGQIDPDGEGDLKHRRTCDWVPEGG